MEYIIVIIAAMLAGVYAKNTGGKYGYEEAL